MPDVQQRAAQAGISVTVTRATGETVEYGLVSYRAQNPLRHWLVWRMLRRGDRLPKEATMRASILGLAFQWLRGSK